MRKCVAESAAEMVKLGLAMSGLRAIEIPIIKAEKLVSHMLKDSNRVAHSVLSKLLEGGRARILSLDSKSRPWGRPSQPFWDQSSTLPVRSSGRYSELILASALDPRDGTWIEEV